MNTRWFNGLHLVFVGSVLVFTTTLVVISCVDNEGGHPSGGWNWFIVAEAVLDAVITLEIGVHLWWAGWSSFFSSWRGYADAFIVAICIGTLVLDRSVVSGEMRGFGSDTSKVCRMLRDIVRMIRMLLFLRWFYDDVRYNVRIQEHIGPNARTPPPATTSTPITCAGRAVVAQTRSGSGPAAAGRSNPPSALWKTPPLWGSIGGSWKVSVAALLRPSSTKSGEDTSYGVLPGSK